MTNTTAERDDCEAARKIYQDHLDKVSDLLLEGQAKACMDFFALPLLIRTTRNEVLFEEFDDLLQDTIHHAASLRGHGVTHYIRLAKRAKRHSETLIEGWHETFILRDAHMVMPSYLSRMFLRFDGQNWVVVEAEHELANERFPMHAVQPDRGGFGDRWTKAEDDIRAKTLQAKPIYQAFLDAVDGAMNARDFSTWSSHYQFPHSIHFEEADHLLETPEDAQRFFDCALEMLDRVPETRLKRTATKAEFISKNQIVGYHTVAGFAQNAQVFGPLTARMILTLKDSRWLCLSVTNSISNNEFFDMEPQFKSELPTMIEIHERMRK